MIFEPDGVQASIQTGCIADFGLVTGIGNVVVKMLFIAVVDLYSFNVSAIIAIFVFDIVIHSLSLINRYFLSH
ncbi:hypothetical protein WK27_12000 [Burkholderia vietnamiensis]|nr:hypothetical protein WK27_12000 [Burkholderia vietnamiensis]